MILTVMARWTRVGRQKIEDAGELCPKRMETVDDEILANAFAFIDNARKDGKPFFRSRCAGMFSSRRMNKLYQKKRLRWRKKNEFDVHRSSECGVHLLRRFDRSGSAEAIAPAPPQ